MNVNASCRDNVLLGNECAACMAKQLGLFHVWLGLFCGASIVAGKHDICPLLLLGKCGIRESWQAFAQLQGPRGEGGVTGTVGCMLLEGIHLCIMNISVGTADLSLLV